MYSGLFRCVSVFLSHKDLTNCGSTAPEVPIDVVSKCYCPCEAVLYYSAIQLVNNHLGVLKESHALRALE